MKTWNLWYAKLKPRHQYYLRFLAPFLILFILLNLSPIDTMYIFFFGLGFVYPLFIYTPDLKEMLDKKKYRLSVMRTLWRLNEFVKSKFMDKEVKFKEEVLNSLVIIIFTMILSLLALNFNFLFTVFGVILFFVLKTKYE